MHTYFSFEVLGQFAVKFRLPGTHLRLSCSSGKLGDFPSVKTKRRETK
jgi:hypothetical protein